MIGINISVGWFCRGWFVSSAALLSGAMHPDGGKTDDGKYKSRFLYGPLRFVRAASR